MAVSNQASKCTTGLSILVADLFVLYVKSLNFHWHVKDPRFLQIHELFETCYTSFAKDIDEVAERIVTLGERAPGTVEEFHSLTRVEENDSVKSADQMIRELASNLSSLVQVLRAEIHEAEEKKDPGTADLLTSLLRKYEKLHWMLSSHLG